MSRNFNSEFQNLDLQTQLEQLKVLISSNEVLSEILARADEIKLPNWYTGAGCLFQSVWNILSGYPTLQNIVDIDMIYFDPEDLSKKTEENEEKRIQELFNHIPIKIDLANEARVHLWYKDRFGYDIQPYTSTEDAIDTWPITSGIGVTVRNDDLKIYAPYGLNDLFGMIVRPNKTQINEEIYLKKIGRWKQCWPALKIIPWNT